MKISYAMFAVVLLGTSVGAMAQDGSDRIERQMNEQRAIAMEHYQNESDSHTAVVSAPTHQPKAGNSQQNEPAPSAQRG